MARRWFVEVVKPAFLLQGGAGRDAVVRATKCPAASTLPPFRQRPTAPAAPPTLPTAPDGTGKRPQAPAHTARRLAQIVHNW